MKKITTAKIRKIAKTDIIDNEYFAKNVALYTITKEMFKEAEVEDCYHPAYGNYIIHVSKNLIIGYNERKDGSIDSCKTLFASEECVKKAETNLEEMKKNQSADMTSYNMHGRWFDNGYMEKI